MVLGRCWTCFLSRDCPVPCCPQEPCLSALLLDKLAVPGALAACPPEAEGRCSTCSTHLHQLTREALHLLQGPASHEDPDSPGGSPGPAAVTSRKESLGPSGPDRKKGLAWAPGPSVQVSVAPAGLGGALSTVTIQAQQCLEGMWGVSRVSGFLPPTYLVSVCHSCAPESPQAGSGSLQASGFGLSSKLAPTVAWPGPFRGRGSCLCWGDCRHP